MLGLVSINLKYQKPVCLAFKGEGTPVLYPRNTGNTWDDKNVQSLVTYLESQNITPLYHSIKEHIVPHDLSREAKKILVPITKNMPQILKFTKANSESIFKNLSPRYNYVTELVPNRYINKSGKVFDGFRLKIKATSKTTDDSYNIVFNENGSSLISFYRCNLDMFPVEKKEGIIKKSVESWEKLHSVNFSQEQKDVITQKALKLKDDLEKKSIEITWNALLNAVMFDLSVEELIAVLNKKSKIIYELVDNIQRYKFHKENSVFEVVTKDSSFFTYKKITTIRRKKLNMDQEPKDPNANNIQRVRKFLKENKVECPTKLENANITSASTAQGVIEVLTPLVKNMDKIKQTNDPISMNDLSDSYDYEVHPFPWKKRVLIRASSKETGDSYLIKFNREGNLLVDFQKMDLENLTPEQKESNLRKQITKLQTNQGIEIPEEEQKILVQRAIKIMDELRKHSIEINWSSLLKVAQHGISAEELIDSLKEKTETTSESDEIIQNSKLIKGDFAFTISTKDLLLYNHKKITNIMGKRIKKDKKPPKPPKYQFSYANSVKDFLEENRVSCTNGFYNANIDSVNAAQKLKCLLKPLTDKMDTIKQIKEVTSFNDLSDNYDYVAKVLSDRPNQSPRLKIKATSKQTGDSYRIIFNREGTILDNCKKIDPGNITTDKKELNVRKQIIRLQTSQGIEIPEEEQKILIQKAIKIMDYLHNLSLDISWNAMLKAAMSDISAEELLAAIKTNDIKSNKDESRLEGTKIYKLNKDKTSYEVWTDEQELIAFKKITGIFEPSLS